MITSRIRSPSTRCASLDDGDATKRKHSCIRSIDESRRLTATRAQVTLDFALDDAHATVTATSRVTPIEGRDGSGGVVLMGRNRFSSSRRRRVNGERLPASAYVVEKDGDDTVMIIKSVPMTTFTLEITTKFKPQENTELSGLYKSSGTFARSARRRISIHHVLPRSSRRHERVHDEDNGG